MMEEKLKEFDLFLLDYKEGSISDENLAKLQNMLKENENLREHFVKQQALDAMLSVEEEFSLPQEIYERPAEPVKGSFNFVYAIAALLAIAFIISFLAIPEKTVDAPSIALSYESGDNVEVIRGKNTFKLVDLDGIQSGDKIITKGQKASLSYMNEETTIVVTENSEVIFEIVDGAKVIRLNAGDIICDVDKQPPGKPMTILTPHAEATVLGTQFLLSAGEDASKLHVTEGAVNFRDKKTNKIFEAKAGWTARISKKADIKSYQHTVNSELIKIFNFTLINADTNKPFPQYDPIPNDSVISISELGTNKINILTNISLKPRYVGGVRFYMDSKSPDGKKLKVYDPRGRQRNRCQESIFPFMFGGDTDDEPVRARPWTVVPGTYKLKAVPFGDTESNGVSGKPAYINFTIIK